MFGLLTLSAVLVEIDLYEGLENVIAAGIGIFSLLLLALSITAFKKTGLRIIIYAIAIFALFAIQQLLDYFEHIFPELDTPLASVLLDSLTLVILVLFFLAIVRSNAS
jgi:membrane protease YdiL (CAAX protease family)